MREMEPAVSRVPYVNCLGNHEHFNNFTGYAARLVPDQNNFWFSYDYNGVHFLALSSEHNYSRGSEQWQFAQADLAKAKANRAAVPWIVVFLHRAFYCDPKGDYYDCNVLAPYKLRPAFEEMIYDAGVDLVLAGHIHNYQRSWPVLNGTVEQQSYSNPRSPVHVVIGMAGDDEGLTDDWSATAPAWSAAHAAKLGWARLTFHSAAALTFEFVLSDSGAVADSFTLTKTREE